MGTGPADSWYHEKESAWLYGIVAAAEPDAARRALFIRLAATAEDQAARWLASRPPAVGIALSLFTGRGAFRGGLRMVLIGGGAGIAAWAVGKLLGATLV